MADEGTEFGVDLYELKLAAREDFPTVSDVYGDSVTSCNQVQWLLAGAMRRPAEFGSEFGPVYASYLALHEIAVDLLRNTRTNLDDTAHALDRAADRYAETDAEAKRELERQLQLEPPTPET